MLLGVVVVLLMGLWGCSQKETTTQEQDGLTIVTSFYPMYAITKEISGEYNQVMMIRSGAGIHSFEPSAADVAAIHDADIFIYHSRTLEPWAKRVNDSSKKDSKVKMIEASEGITLDRVEGLEDIKVEEGIDEKTLFDPHSWLDPELVALEAENIAEQLIALDSEHADTYRKNAQEFAEKARGLVTKYQPIFEQVPQKTFVTQHTAFSYLAKRFGLRQLGISGISPDLEPSPKRLKEIQDFVEEYHVKTIFVEPNVSTDIAQVIAEETGVQIALLDPLESDPQNNLPFLTNLENNLQTLQNVLGE